MKALLLAAAIVLPPEVQGVWTSEDEQHIVELDAEALSLSTYGGNAIQTVTCDYADQIPGKFGYALSCTDQIDRVLEFYDTGVMALDGVRFTYGD